jgi:hypothetical protein
MTASLAFSQHRKKFPKQNVKILTILIFYADPDKQTSRQADKWTSRQADKQTSRQADKQTNRQKLTAAAAHAKCSLFGAD